MDWIGMEWNDWDGIDWDELEWESLVKLLICCISILVVWASLRVDCDEDY